jgi:hypothetical protein
MGYFDALISGTFKTTPDGKRLFFPWGTLGRAYVVRTEADYQRMRSQIKTSLAAGMVVIIALVATRAYQLGFAATALWCVLYAGWVAWRVRGLDPSDERLTWREATTAQARTHSALFLWFGAICSLGFVAVGIFMLTVDSSQPLVAGGGILFFGFCAFQFARMLLLRRRQ